MNLDREWARLATEIVRATGPVPAVRVEQCQTDRDRYGHVECLVRPAKRSDLLVVVPQHEPFGGIYRSPERAELEMPWLWPSRVHLPGLHPHWTTILDAVGHRRVLDWLVRNRARRIPARLMRELQTLRTLSELSGEGFHV